MSEKMGNPYVAAEKPPTRPKKIPTMVKALGLATALHAGAYYEPEIAEGARAGMEVVGENVERWQVQREHDAALSEALGQIESGDVDVWRFVRVTQRSQATLRGETPPPSESVDANFDEMSHRLHERLGDMHVIRTEEERQLLQQALLEAFEGYHYQLGANEWDVESLLNDRGGTCGQVSMTILSLLDREGFESQLAVRRYPPDSTGYGHAAPTIRYMDERGEMAEYDLVGGGRAAPGGVMLTVPEIVRTYAAHVDHLRDQAGAGHHSWNLPVSFPEDSRPFEGGLVPFYSGGLIGAYQTDMEGNVVDMAGGILRPADTEAAPHSEGERSSSDEMELESRVSTFAQRAPRRLFDQVITFRPNTDQESNSSVELAPRLPFSDADWTSLSEALSYNERSLQEQQDPLGRAIIGARQTGLYRIAQLESALLHRTSSARLAESRAHEFRTRALEDLTVAEARGSTVRTGAEEMANLVYLGRPGCDAALRYYRDVQQDQERNSFQQRRDKTQILRALILAPESRSEALSLASGMSTLEQFYLAESMRELHGHHRHSEVPAPPVFEGEDSFSRSYRAQNDIFSYFEDDLSGRYVDSSDNIVETHSSARLTTEQMRTRIHQVAENFHRDPAWEEEVFAYLVTHLSRLALEHIYDLVIFPESEEFLERNRAFVTECIRWAEEHPQYDGLVEDAHILAAFLG